MEEAVFNEVMLVVDEISRTCDSDACHNTQVTGLALAFFDGLGPLHRYGPEERRLLEIASRLHDIGSSKTVVRKHHVLSGKMILKLDIPGLNGRDKLACALVARYHTKALPNATKHRKFAALGAKARHRVEWLAAILRVADALDSSHNSVVRAVKMRVSDEEIAIQLATNGDCWHEIRRVRRKQDLLVKKSGRTVVYQC